jgi:FtsP/CotA-like multicopper oxidase with cupredoxin domain
MQTRRSVLAGLIATGLPGSPVLGQPAPAAAPDGFRVIRARENGYDGAIPGPVLHMRRGEELKMRLINETATPTAIHWHGVRVPNAMDGTTLVQKPVPPGGNFDYRFVPPDAGTFWYRASPRTANRALHGLLIVQEASATEIDADVALILAGADDKLTANGVASLDIAIRPNDRLRLRLANATEHLVTLGIADHPMHVVAIDGQPAEPFLARGSRITLSPGNRADVLVDAVMKPESIASITLWQGDAARPLGRLIYADSKVRATMPDGHAGRPVKPLPANPLPERMDFRGAQRADVPIEAGATGLPARPLFAVKRGRTVMLALPNKSDAPIVTHIHGHAVRLLDALDDGWKPFWLDTILCLPRQTTRVAFVADNPGKWLLEARVIGSDTSSLAWFDVS